MVSILRCACLSNNDAFSTNLYRKKTFTGLYSHFSRQAPIKYKSNVIRVLVYRAFYICSSYQNFHEEILRIKEILTGNCLPKSLIYRIIENFLDSQFGRNPPLKPNDTVPFILTPYLGEDSLQIEIRLCRVVKQCYPNIQLKDIFRSSKRIGSLFSFIDHFSVLMRSSVIYKFQRPGCYALSYGKTSRNLITKCRENLGVNKAGRKRKVSQSAIGDHIVG